MKPVFFLGMLMSMLVPAPAQELVPNGGFEIYQGKGKCQPWTQARGDFNHFWHKDLNPKHQGAAHGKGYHCLCMYGLEENEFLHVKLSQALQKGRVYRLSMNVRMSLSTDEVYKREREAEMKRLDWYFTPIPINVINKLLITAEPSVSFPFVMPHPEKWTQLAAEYTATGEEKFLTIGNITRMYEMMKVSPQVNRLRNELKQLDAKEQRSLDSVRILYAGKDDLKVVIPPGDYSMNPYAKQKKLSRRQQKENEELQKRNLEISMKIAAAQDLVKREYRMKRDQLTVSIDEEAQQYKVNVCFDDISITPIEGKTATVEDPLLSMEPVTGNTLVLKNVYFNTDSYDLLPESFVQLDLLVAWLKQHAGTSIQLNGHTDSDGSEEHNLKLSENRSRAVMRYLVDKGIAPGRLKYEGYAAMFPLADNTSAEGKALNRRVEFTVL